MAKEFIDRDAMPDALVAELLKNFEAAAKRIRTAVLTPPGRTASAQAFNQSRAAQQMAQIDRIVRDLKNQAGSWTATAIAKAIQQGLTVADQMLKDAGVRNPGSPLVGSFAVVDPDAVITLARDTIGDLVQAAEGMKRTADTAIRRMAATGVTNAEVNRILAGGVIEGKPVQAIRQLRESLRSVHGDKVSITTPKGTREYGVGYYAEMVARTKTREAVVNAKNARMEDRGITLVRIVGRISKNFCTEYVGKIYSLTGDHPRYPALDELPNGGPPFHPNCSKSTAPFVEKLASKVELEEGAPEPTRRGKVLSPQERVEALAEDILSRARAGGFED